MDSIIITIIDSKYKTMVDIEVPANQEMSTLKRDIVDALNGFNPQISLVDSSVELVCNRTKHRLEPDETMSSSGVWNGDYITVVRRA